MNSDDEGAPKITKGNYNIWRIMIDKKFQGKGFGKKAMNLAIEFVNTFPCGTQNIVGYLMKVRMM